MITILIPAEQGKNRIEWELQMNGLLKRF